MALADLRQEYALRGLHEDDLDRDPIAQFRAWFVDAQQAGGVEPNAMTLATASPDGQPAARTVLLKGLDERGFVFYSNYESDKGRELDANPRAELLFYWPALERQVRVRGTVERVTRAESEAYFHSRPKGSQLGATVSPQSRVIPGRDALEREHAALQERYADADVPLPDFWGGYRVLPTSIEFWQGRKSRLHDRLRYRRDATDAWIVERLAP
jgi:pyridoxamine 5'-phosphate oxidase